VSLKWLVALLEVLKLPVTESELKLVFSDHLVYIDGPGCAHRPRPMCLHLSVLVD
jgi:hypothetical protein